MILGQVKILLVVLVDLFFLLEAHNAKRDYEKLLHVSVIFRHGERAPYSTYPRDPYASYPWPDGLGQLLNNGKLQSYNLGKFLRKQYKELLNTVHSHTKILVESSDMDRTIMSAQYFMAGFYMPNRTQRISKELRWQPIPIHTSSITQQNYIWVNAPCPKMDNLTSKFFQSSKMKKNYDRNKKTFQYLQRHSGHTFSRDTIGEASWKLYDILDILEIQAHHNLTLPSWTKKVYPRRMKRILSLFLYKEFSDPRILRFVAGPMLKSITADMKSSSNQSDNSTRKFHFYSGHDNSLASIMYALGNYEGVNPPYCAALIFELRNKGNEDFITIRYLNSSQPVLHSMEIPKCGKPCTLDKFEKMTHPLILKNWKNECRHEKQK